MNPLIPAPDILPLPAPAWLFETLLIVTFLVHVLFMNMLFGGVLLGAFSGLLGKRDERHQYLAKKIFSFLPVVIAFTVNFGIPPLLFVQVLYGNLLYTSSILMATFWIAVIPLLILGYYSSYTLKFSWDRVQRFRLPLMGFAACVYMTIAFFFVNNLTLMQRPTEFVAHYFQNPVFGSLNWSDPSLYPRYLHMLLGAVGVAGVWLMIIGARGKTGDAAWSAWMVSFGFKVFLHATAANILTGLWFLMALPDRVMMTFMGGDPLSSALLLISLILAILAYLVLKKATRLRHAESQVYLGASLLYAGVLAMLLMRHFMRHSYLEPNFSLSALRTVVQWDVMLIFFVLFLFVMIPALAWLIHTAASAVQTER